MKRLNAEKVLDITRPKGLLSEKISGFEARESQQKMLADVVDVYNNNGIALIEAGTGTGKSIAYLLPALIWASLNNERTLISTNTIALQEQLINKDIPLLTHALGLELKAVLVKGMSNYLCLRKLADLKQEILFLTQEELSELDRIEAWAKTTREGSRSDLNFVPSYSVWDKVSAEQEACSNRDCEFYKECHFFKARRRAIDAHLLVANHAMLFADLAITAEGDKDEAGILPKYTRIVLDEAHHIEDVATEFLALKNSRLGLLHIIGKLVGDKNGKMASLKQKLQQYFKTNLSTEISSIFSRINIDIPALRRAVYEDIEAMFLAYEGFLRDFDTTEERANLEKKLRILPFHTANSKWQERVVPYSKKLIESLNLLQISFINLLKDLALLRDEKLKELLKGVFLDMEGLLSRLSTMIETLKVFIQDPEPSQVRWIECQQARELTNTQLVNAQLDIAKVLQKNLFKKFPTIILCSATLATNKDFSFIRNRLGLIKEELADERIIENIYDSPFNYRQQALFGVPTDLPDPADPAFVNMAVEQIWQLIQASHGNAFVLFTSYQMLQQFYQLLAPRLGQYKYPCMKQGDTNRQALLNQFRKTERAVLFGTDSFWEGVDVAGDALRCVILVKLPFKVPSDPMIQARAENILVKGGHPFQDYLLPNAIVKFKQGVGRLIRKNTDRGCVICLDTRILKKNYGTSFLNSLPDYEKVFLPGKELKERMAEFYRKTYFLVQKSK